MDAGLIHQLISGSLTFPKALSVVWEYEIVSAVLAGLSTIGRFHW